MSARTISLVVLPAKLAVSSRGHHRRIRAHAKSELLLECVGLCEYVVTYLLVKCGHACVNLAKLVLLLGIQANSLALEALVPALEHHLLLAGQRALVCVVNGLDPGIESLVEINVGAVRTQQANRLFHHGVEFLGAVCLGHIKENAFHFRKDAS